jgi:undecaprenyl-diphosphatase
MLEAIVSGIAQGIAEWLPISSEGVLFILKKSVFASDQSSEIIIREALFLHLGTFFAALIYFRKLILNLFKDFFNFSKASEANKRLIVFLVIATFITGILGYGLMKLLTAVENKYEWLGSNITLLVGMLLLITAYLQYKSRKTGLKSLAHLKKSDGILLGIVQGFAVLPGLSRSGLTVASLLLKKYDRVAALKLSILMSLPVVLAGNVLLNLDKFVLNTNLIIALFFAFIFGLITIDILLKVANKINFALFVFIFGILTIVAAFI